MRTPAATATGTETVTVACKYPAGLLLRLFHMEEAQEPVLGGGWRTVKKAVQSGQTIRINGPAKRVEEALPWQVLGGYALTPGVPADFWAEWLQQNADSELVKNGLIFASERREMAEGEAREKVEIKSGLEPLDPQNLPKVGRLKVERGTTREAA